MDVQNTVEVLDFSEKVLNDLAEAKSDDGKISVTEIVGMAFADAPAAVNAALGADQIAAELSDLSADEVKLLAAKGLAVAKAAMKFFAVAK